LNKSKTPKVSICIPAYEQTTYLRKALDSIVKQTFSDYEVIITDDSKSKDVGELVNSYQNNKFQYIKNNPALGSPENWNKGIQAAKGEYIKILHHDDWFTADQSLEKFVSALENNPGVNFVYCATQICNAQNNTNRLHSSTLDQQQLLAASPYWLFCGNFIGAPSVCIYRRSINESYDTNLKWLVDVDFYIRVLKNNNFLYLDEPLVATITGASHTLTSKCENNKHVEIYEYFYLFDKIKKELPPDIKKACLNQLKTILKKFRITRENEITEIIKTDTAHELRRTLFRNYLVNLIKR